MAQATLARTEDYSKYPNSLMLTFRPTPRLWVVLLRKVHPPPCHLLPHTVAVLIGSADNDC